MGLGVDDTDARWRRRRKVPGARLPIIGTLVAWSQDLRDRLAVVWHLRSILAQQDAANESFRAAVAESLQGVGDEVMTAQSILVALDREHQDGHRVTLGAVYALAEEVEDLRRRVLDLERRDVGQRDGE